MDGKKHGYCFSAIITVSAGDGERLESKSFLEQV